MDKLTYDDLAAACSPGGPSTLVSRTELVPAAGEHASIAPAKFALDGKKHGAYAYEPRFIDGIQVQTVIIDSKQSVLNRIESELKAAIDSGDETIALAPRIEVTYTDASGVESTFSDLELPHRAFDAHIRSGTFDGTPVTSLDVYRAARNATAANARALLELSPGSLVFGSWDSTRKAHQGRWRSVLVGEIIGVVPSDRVAQTVLRGGARVDPVAMQVNVGGRVMQELADAQQDELSAKNYTEISKDAKKLKDGSSGSASRLGFGGVPPTLSALAGVNCSRIIRTHVLSFAALRQMRFGSTLEGDIASRSLLAAWALAGLARSDRELYLRANCDLREAAPTEVEMDARGGQVRALAPLTVDEADAVLRQAIDAARTIAGIEWKGQILEVVGNSEVFAGAVDAVDEDN